VISIERENVVISPPPKGDAYGGGKITSIGGASKDSRMEQLASELK
jgi:hypothetical protein